MEPPALRYVPKIPWKSKEDDENSSHRVSDGSVLIGKQTGLRSENSENVPVMVGKATCNGPIPPQFPVPAMGCDSQALLTVQTFEIKRKFVHIRIKARKARVELVVDGFRHE